MKIVISVHTYWPQKNGVQYVTQYLAEGLAKRGHEVVIITCSSDKKEIGSVLHNGVKVITAFLKTKYSMLNIGKRNVIYTLSKEIENADVLINCCVQSPINNIILSKLNKVSCPKILYMHGMHDFAGKSDAKENIKYYLWHCFMNVRWGLFYLLNKNKFALYDLMIDIYENSGSFSFFKKLGVRVPHCVIHNAVEEFTQRVNPEADFLDEKYFLCVANYNDRKNQKGLVKAYEHIKSKNGYKLVMIGARSNYSDELKEYIKSNNLEQDVLLIEDLDRSKTKNYIAKCYCAILASKYEVYPIFLCESIACGHPYISTNVGCVKDIPGGIIVESENGLTDAMQNAINSPEEMIELGKIGYRYAQDELTQNEKVKQLENEIIKIVK